jgi:hypothetical protein
MHKLARTALTGAAFILLASSAHAATCVNKAGAGTGGSKDSAMFQAYEAVLQATDWGAWSQWIASGQKVGVAPGYKVSNLKSSCKPGGLGQNCTVQATLCK